MWDLSCPDWEARLRGGQSLIPDLPLFEDGARDGLAFFDEFRLPDVPDEPRLGDAAGEWFRDLVRATFGSWDPQEGVRWIRDIFCLAPKAQSKTTFSAGLMLAVMLMNRRRNCQALFIGPTQSISDRAFEQAVGMIEIDKAAQRRFKIIEHEKTIEDRILGAEMKVKTFDANILTGSILIFALLDELHLLGRSAHTTKVLRQIRGGLDKTPEGVLLITTTQSDDMPAGAFKDELMQARKIRDGAFKGMSIRPMLPVLYEFPREIGVDPVKWQDPVNWPMILPNLGRSVHLRDLIPDWNTEKGKGEHAVRIWASQHLNIEIGLGLMTDRWAGADYWEEGSIRLSLEDLIERSEAAVVGIDGGGLDDLLGLAVIGREVGTGHWLVWTHAWAHPIALERRKSEAGRLHDFASDGDLQIVDRIGDDIEGVADIVEQLAAADLLPAKNAVGLDPVGIGQIVDELSQRGITEPRIVGVSQGWKLSGAIKTAERKLADGTFRHSSQPLMAWCVGNARVEPRGNAITITKQTAGTGKIDPLMATFNAVALMSMNPPSQRSIYESRGLLVI